MPTTPIKKTEEKKVMTPEVVKKPVDKPVKAVESGANADIATAIAQGFKQSKEDSFTLVADPGIEPRFTVVQNKLGEVLLRENETGHLSKVQLESIEEKEASIQGQDVEVV